MIGLNKSAGGIRVNEKEIPVMDFYDVVVIGGGVAGVAAGMAAGKRGMKTIILETFTALGGLTTLGLVNIPLDFVSGLGKEMFNELEKVKGLWHRNTDPEKHKLVLDRMIKKYNVEVLLVTQVVDAIMDGDTVKGAVIQFVGNIAEDVALGEKDGLPVTYTLDYDVMCATEEVLSIQWLFSVTDQVESGFPVTYYAQNFNAQTGQEEKIQIRAPFAIREAYLTDLDENILSEAEVKEGKAFFTVKPYTVAQAKLVF